MLPNNQLDKKRSNVISWATVFLIGILGVFAFFIVKLLILQNTDVEIIEKKFIKNNFDTLKVPAFRGSLYSADGSVIATTLMRYNCYVDMAIIKPKDFSEHKEALADSLSRMYGKTKLYFLEKLTHAKKDSNQYFNVGMRLNYDDYQRLKQFPLFSVYNPKKKVYERQRCFLVPQKMYLREFSTSKIGAGIVGMVNSKNDGVSGFESAFNNYLRGKDGSQSVQRIGKNQWKPVDFWSLKEPTNGKDVYTTLDIRIQDIAYAALLRSMKKYDAKSGQVIVMEVETGKVRAMVNLKQELSPKTKNPEFIDDYNVIAKNNFEPGSTFKTVTLLAAIDDGFVDETTKIEIGSQWNYAGTTFKNPYRVGTYSIVDILANSNNVGTAKIIVKSYAKDPNIFFDHLRKWKMMESLHTEIETTKPRFYTPENPRWNKATLGSVSFGYTMSLPILQMANFYNSIANKGKMLKPLFIDKIVSNGQIEYKAKPKVLVESMASPKTIEMLTNILVKTVEKGTAKSIFTPNIKLAGKTGTARYDYKDGKTFKHRGSFVGFFPADAPKYTCMVVLSDTNHDKGSYGGQVAAPVFQEIAGKVFLKTPINVPKEMLTDRHTNLNKTLVSIPSVGKIEKMMPDLSGQIGMKAIAWIENQGYRVEYKGVGKVISQFPKAGENIRKEQKIYLKLN